jgi:transposase
MNNKENSLIRRSQKDYNLGFKLSVVSQVEKGEMTYNKHSSLMEFKEGVLF